MKITEHTTVIEALKKSRTVAEVFKKYNLDCPGCKGATEDTLGIVAENNGLDIKTLLKEMNEGLKK